MILSSQVTFGISSLKGLDLSGYLVKRTGYSKVQGPYSVTRLKRYVDEQRLHSDDLISKDGQTWRDAGESRALFPLLVTAEDLETLTLSVEPDFSDSSFDDATASTLLEEIDLSNYKETHEDTAYGLNYEPGYFNRESIPYVVLSTYFVFGISFGFGLFMALQTIMTY